MQCMKSILIVYSYLHVSCIVIRTILHRGTWGILPGNKHLKAPLLSSLRTRCQTLHNFLWNTLEHASYKHLADCTTKLDRSLHQNRPSNIPLFRSQYRPISGCIETCTCIVKPEFSVYGSVWGWFDSMYISPIPSWSQQ